MKPIPLPSDTPPRTPGSTTGYVGEMLDKRPARRKMIIVIFSFVLAYCVFSQSREKQKPQK
ncbi:hypothetical protein OUZ56_007157 [Daphnia magna]|uniref:Uncharacterized protein n=1 Tax=Daphnia magna TaxID=35525 RepID=A0ABQ9YXR9_9CRUS|nr:hypothetical protein OUZ56_007157 [Daphnia magna]